MDACFGLHIAIGIGTLDRKSDGLDPRFLGHLEIHDLGLEAAPFTPLQIHLHEHLGPVHTLDAACTGMDRDDGVVFVHISREEQPEFYFVEIIAKSRQFAIDLFEENFTFIFIENGEGFIEICDLLGGQFKG